MIWWRNGDGTPAYYCTLGNRWSCIRQMFLSFKEETCQQDTTTYPQTCTQPVTLNSAKISMRYPHSVENTNEK